MSNNTSESLWQDLFNDKGVLLLIVAGLLLVLCNVVVAFGLEPRPKNWLFYLNPRHWSLHMSVFLWAAAIWAILESTDFVEDYLPLIRTVMTIGFVLVIIFAFHSSEGASPASARSSLWSSILIAAVIGCALRSLLLLYVYWNEGLDTIDMEEAQWFWGMSGFIFTGLLLVGLTHIIPAQTQYHPAAEPMVTTFYNVCYVEMETLIRNGTGSTGIRMLGLLIVVFFIAFVFVLGKWTLVFVSKKLGGE